MHIKVKLATIVEGNPKDPFSIATTPMCRGGRYSFPGRLSTVSMSKTVLFKKFSLSSVMLYYQEDFDPNRKKKNVFTEDSFLGPCMYSSAIFDSPYSIYSNILGNKMKKRSRLCFYT